MTNRELAKIEDWLREMRVFTDKALVLARRLNCENISDDDDLFWALVKYAENVQESIKQLDNINKSILPILEEIPNKSQDATDISWEGFKKMREILAHQFRNIDPKILWDVVTKEFPVLNRLLQVLVVGEGVAGKSFKVRFRAGLSETYLDSTPQYSSRRATASFVCSSTIKARHNVSGLAESTMAAFE